VLLSPLRLVTVGRPQPDALALRQTRRIDIARTKASGLTGATADKPLKANQIGDNGRQLRERGGDNLVRNRLGPNSVWRYGLLGQQRLHEPEDCDAILRN
jgi:hypothetical protein